MAARKKKGVGEGADELDLFRATVNVTDRSVGPLGNRSVSGTVRDPSEKASQVALFTRDLTVGEVVRLREVLLGRGWALEQRPYMEFFVKRPDLSVSVYTKGPKMVVQGKGTTDFLEFILEPEVTGILAMAGAEGSDEEVVAGDEGDEVGHIGVDESGKGDFFGPLVVAAVFVDAGIALHFREIGVMDSKRIGSDDRIRVLAERIRSTRGVAFETVVIAPPRYNELYTGFKNLNRMLAWGHARVIEDVLERRPDCPRALSDQFAHPSLINRALMTRGKKITMEQRTKAESDVAVAAASILARDKFVEWISNASVRMGLDLPKGASAAVKAAGIALVNRFGPAVLLETAKVHFKTASEIAPDFFVKPPLQSDASSH